MPICPVSAKAIGANTREERNTDLRVRRFIGRISFGEILAVENTMGKMKVVIFPREIVFLGTLVLMGERNDGYC